MAAAGKGGEVEVFLDDTLHRFPRTGNVARGAPGVGDVAGPGAGVSPAAEVIDHALLLAGLDGIANFGVLRLHVKPHVVAAAVVHLDEVVVPLVEIGLAVGLFVLVETHAAPPGGRVARAAGVVARIAVDAGLEAQRVDVVGHGAHAVGKLLGVDVQPACFGVAAVPVAVVDVDILVAGSRQTFAHHGVGLLADEFFADAKPVGVPRAPPHGGRIDGLKSQGPCQQTGGKNRSLKCFHRFLVFLLSLTAKVQRNKDTTSRTSPFFVGWATKFTCAGGETPTPFSSRRKRSWEKRKRI